MRTYQHLRAGSAGEVVMNNLIVGTAFIWVPIAIVGAIYLTLTAKSNNERAAEKEAMFAQGQAGYNKCKAKYDSTSGPALIFREPCYIDQYVKGPLPNSNLNLEAQHAEVEKRRLAAIAAVEPWSPLRCESLAKRIRDNTYWAKQGQDWRAVEAEKGQAEFKAHGCNDGVAVVAKRATIKPVLDPRREYKPLETTDGTVKGFNDAKCKQYADYPATKKYMGLNCPAFTVEEVQAKCKQYANYPTIKKSLGLTCNS